MSMSRSHPRTRRRLTTSAAIAILCGLSLAQVGCGVGGFLGATSCDRSEKSNPPLRYTEGTVEDGIYMSSAWDGELLYFPSGMRYLIEHKLGRVPRHWEFYLSFDQFGSKTGVVAPASGNEAELRGVDEETMTVVNGSCVEYWLLVTASAGEDGGADGGSGGSGGSGGGVP